MLTLNSQQEYQASETALRDAQRVMIVGGGLIGTELAMDFCRAGKSVTLVDHAASILSSLMPAEVSSRLQHRLTDMGVHLLLKSQLHSLSKTEGGIRVTLDRSRSVEVDAVIAATGLRPETGLAHRAGAETGRGVKVNSYLQTTQPDIYALGDCAEINGQVLPFLQPIQLSAMYLAKNLLGGSAPLKLPAMLIKVKTPELPLHLAGETQRQDLNWQITLEPQGMVARGADNEGQLRAFVVSEDRMKEAFSLLKLLPA
jgi:nitric oxide reductase FlRd-NAD(+) reductase